MADRVNIAGTVKVSTAQVKDAAASTSITALAGVSGKIPQLHGIVISTDTEGTYAVKIGSTTKVEFYFAGKSGYTAIFAPYYLENGTANEAISVTKPMGATTSVTIFYTLEVSF